MKKLIAFAEMVDEMLKKLLPDALHIAVEKGAKVVGSSRCCIVLPVKNNRLVLHAGYPKEGHSVGQEVVGKHADFLKNVMHKDRCVVHVHDPARDPRTPHLKEHVAYRSITSIVFAPLLKEEKPLGIMVFDFTSTLEISAETTRTAGIVSDFVAGAIAHAHGNAQEKDDAVQKKLVSILGQRYSQIAHVTRNALTSSGGHAQHLKDDDSLSGTGRKRASMIFEDIMKLERVTQNVLDYTQFNPKHLAFKKYDAEEFLQNLLEKERSLYQGVHLHPLHKSNHDIMIHLDKEMMEAGLSDIIRNATAAGAKNIWVKMKVKPRKKWLLISIAHDGKEIEKEDLIEIFNPFFSLKKGAILGLAKTEAIVRGHDGMITAESKTKKRCVKTECRERTIFKIYLPLQHQHLIPRRTNVGGIFLIQ